MYVQRRDKRAHILTQKSVHFCACYCSRNVVGNKSVTKKIGRRFKEEYVNLLWPLEGEKRFSQLLPKAVITWQQLFK